MSMEQTRSPAADRVSLWSTVRKPILLILGLTIAGLVLRRWDASLNASFIDRFIVGRGVLGEVTFVLVGAAACAAGVPRQALAFAASYAFGVWTGAALALGAQGMGCLVSFGWARLLGRRWAERRLRGRLARADRFLASHPFAATLVFRLLPFGNSLALSLLAGISAVPLLPFLAASVLGFVPQTVIFALLGGGVRIAHGTQIGTAVVLFVGSAAGGLWLLRRQRQFASVALGSEDGHF